MRVELQSSGGKRHVLRVSDNGIGLPRDLDFRRPNTLGLQLVHDLAEQLRGEVSVSHEPETAFTITFEEAGGGEIEL